MLFMLKIFIVFLCEGGNLQAPNKDSSCHNREKDGTITQEKERERVSEREREKRRLVCECGRC